MNYQEAIDKLTYSIEWAINKRCDIEKVCPLTREMRLQFFRSKLTSTGKSVDFLKDLELKGHKVYSNGFIEFNNCGENIFSTDQNEVNKKLDKILKP